MSNDFFDAPAGTTGGQVEGAASFDEIPDMDALFEKHVDFDDVRKTQSDSLKPVGSYHTVPVLNVQANRVKEGANAGRLMIRFFGPATLLVTEKNAKAAGLPVGTEIKAQFGFGISPERANKVQRDGTPTGEPDHSSKLWAQAVSAYEVAYKQKAATIGDVVRYVQNYPVVIRVIQVGVASAKNPEPDGEPGNIVMGISPVREPS